MADETVLDNDWVHVVVSEHTHSPYNSRVVVNLYGFPTKRQAQAAKRKTDQESIDYFERHPKCKLIASRVRPVLREGRDYVSENDIIRKMN